MVGRRHVRQALLAIALGTAASCGDNRPPTAGGGGLTADPAVVTSCLPSAPLAGTARAKPLACDAEKLPGALAAGRLGDFVLENALVRIVVRGPGEGFYLHGGRGGSIVDAARVGGEDLVKEITPLVGLAGVDPLQAVITEAGDDGPATLVVRGQASLFDGVAASGVSVPAGMELETQYRLPADSRALEIATRVIGEAPVSSAIADSVLLGGRARFFAPGAGAIESGENLSMVATTGTTSSYGIVYESDVDEMVLRGEAGLRLVSAAASHSGVRWFVIGDGSISSVTDAAYPLLGKVVGSVRGTSAPSVDVHAVGENGRLVTIARSDPNGAYQMSLPDGRMQLVAMSPGRAPGTPVPVTVRAGQVHTADVPAGAGGEIAIIASDDEGRPLPSRVELENGDDKRHLWTGADGRLLVQVPVGTWRVTVSRGLEYDAFVAGAVNVGRNGRRQITAQLSRVVDTSGWISIDTHLHCEMSGDSSIPIDDRVSAVAAEGVEVAVSSDHDVITAYGPTIAALGLTSHLATVQGTEVSTRRLGHINGWPLIPALDRTGRGSPRWTGLSPAQIFEALRTRGDGEAIVQVNHPRRAGSGLFGALGLEASSLSVRSTPADVGLPDGTDLSPLTFDAVEVANGKAASDLEDTFADWLALVGAGHPAVATGSSDSHFAAQFAGRARTFVWVGVGNDDPGSVDLKDVHRGLRQRKAVVATGAFVTLELSGKNGVAGIGDVADIPGGTPVSLSVRIQAPPWQPLARLTVYQGTSVAATINLDPRDTRAVRFDQPVLLAPPSGQTFYVARVDLAEEGRPVLDSMQPSFTNPVFVRPVASPD